MSQENLADDPEPSEPSPAGLLFVPARSGPGGCTTLFFRTPLGDRVAVGFTTEQRLTAVLGSRQRWIRLSEPAVRSLATPLGVRSLVVDPRFAAPATSGVRSTVPRTTAGPSQKPGCDRAPQSAGLRRITGAAALGTCLNLLIG